ncbi:unnamed protein product [Colias eurytheme]|nr:unnamed protein product [Colias eurytheme]
MLIRVSIALVNKYIPYFTDNSRSEYYGKVKNILYPDDVTQDDPKMRVIDGMLYDYVDIASTPPIFKDCVPFVSQYSDCSIENICVGCTVCHCDMMGRWNCSQLQKCRPDPELVVDHQTLVIAMENLLEEEKVLVRRRKRSPDFEETLRNYEDISKWMYGISPFDFEDINNETEHVEIDKTTKRTNTIDSEIFNFEQFLIDVGYDVHTDEEGNDTVDEKINKTTIGHIQGHNLSDYKDFFNMLENVTKTTDAITSILDNASCVVEPNEGSYKAELPINAYELLSDYLKKQNELLTHIIMPHNITKREALHTHIGRNNTNNITIFIKNITENSFYPLENIIKEKQEELSELINIRDNLLDSINAYVGFEVSNLTNTNKIQNADLRFIIFKIDKTNDANLSNILRIDNRSLLEKYQLKLKKDIGEVIRDIAVIQRLPKSSNIAHELRYLIRALRHYVKNLPGKNNVKSNKNITDNNFRRRFISDKPRITNPILLLNNILELLDKGTPQGNILSLLSKNVMKLIKRIINQLYTDELVGVHSKLNDEYNLANNLREIGRNWQNRMADINNCIPSERLYKMKLFHLELSGDIDTLKDVLILRGFAERRRMSLIKDGYSEKKVMENLIKIHNDIKRINKMANKPFKKISPSPNRIKKNHGFLQKVKTLLKKSKQGIRGMLKKKKVTPDMIKKIAKKQLDDITKKKLTKYEEPIYRWQDNLNIVPRIKRSPNGFQNFMNRVKNIIPGYLHKKVKPAVDSKRRHKNGTRNVTRRVKKHRIHKTSKMPE